MWFPLSLCPPKSCGTVGLYAHCDHPLNGWGSQGLVGDIATLGRHAERETVNPECSEHSQ